LNIPLFSTLNEVGKLIQHLSIMLNVVELCNGKYRVALNFVVGGGEFNFVNG